MDSIKFVIGLVLGGVLLVWPLFGKSRADRLTKLLTAYIGCAAVMWSLFGFLQSSSEQHGLIFRSFKYFVGGGLVGLGVALLTHLYLVKSARNHEPAK